MRTFKLSKLVRDKIVQNHLDSGGKVEWKKLDAKSKQKELFKKIIEEAREAQDSDDLVEELADIQEAIDQIASDAKISKAEITKMQAKKRRSNGGFKNGDYIQRETWPNNHKWAKYYGKDPKRFPEIK